MIPRATYRVQLNRAFTFADTVQIVPYLAQLGVSHLYASPILAARPGSPHGYDVIDPSRVNPELGGEEGLRVLVAALRRHGLGLIVDIVPNHMYAGAGNEWWRDVLRYGRTSVYAKFFDIDWDALGGKVLLPILGKPFGEALTGGDITFDGSAIRYFDHDFPVAPGTGTAASLVALLDLQHYRLAWWRTAADEINWRRFFDINDLVAVRVEDPDVFVATHATLFRLVGEGLIDGFRVDHVDGLADPAGYCRSVRTELNALRPESAYLIVEKILARREYLPARWHTDGTVGYDFMNDVSGVQHDPAGEVPLSKIWSEVAHRPEFEIEERSARQEILARSFTAALEALVGGLADAAARGLATRDFAAASLRRCVVALLSRLSVYRTYPDEEENNAAAFDSALKAAAQTIFSRDREAMTWLGARLRPPTSDAIWRRLQVKFEQLSAPLAAKAVEDTAFYRYGRLLSRNDVGFDPSLFALAPTSFHEATRTRHKNFPHAMLATATHDHKRGEDVRARLAVLSEIPDVWRLAIERCFAAHGKFRSLVDGGQAPHPGDELMLYQTVVGAWPLELSVEDSNACGAFARRIVVWQRKALREAKLATDWIVPNTDYEVAAERFVQRLFAEPGDGLLILADLARRIGPAGAINGLAQILLKLTLPGVPDFYQGTELWDLSLVDPDNRHPVDYRDRAWLVRQASAMGECLSSWRDGRVKQAVIKRVLALRRERPSLFADAGYQPLCANGPAAKHVLAFARSHETATLLVLVSRLPFHLLPPNGSIVIDPKRWHETTLSSQDIASGTTLVNVLNQHKMPWRRAMPVSVLFGDLPIAILINA